MAPDTAVQQILQRIGTIVEQLESAGDPHTRALARQLLESLMAFHGAALDRIMEIVSSSGPTREATIQSFASDKLVSSLLLLYGLHPDDLSTRVNRALEDLRGFLESHSAKAGLVAIREDGTVTVRLDVKANGCGSTPASVKAAVESALQDAAPDAAAILVEDSGLSGGLGFVPVAQLLGARPAMALSAGRSQGLGE